MKGLVFSKNYHWLRQDSNTCPQSNISNDNFHWTQAANAYHPNSRLFFFFFFGDWRIHHPFHTNLIASK